MNECLALPLVVLAAYALEFWLARGSAQPCASTRRQRTHVCLVGVVMNDHQPGQPCRLYARTEVAGMQRRHCHADSLGATKETKAAIKNRQETGRGCHGDDAPAALPKSKGFHAAAPEQEGQGTNDALP